MQLQEQEIISTQLTLHHTTALRPSCIKAGQRHVVEWLLQRMRTVTCALDNPRPHLLNPSRYHRLMLLLRHHYLLPPAPVQLQDPESKPDLRIGSQKASVVVQVKVNAHH